MTITTRGPREALSMRTCWLTPGVGTLALLIASLPASASAGSYPTHFTGEALTVAFAFALPALIAGSYLAMHRLSTRLGGRTLVALALTVTTVGTLSLFIEDKAALMHRTIAALQ